MRFKSGEKSLYKEINRDISIKFPIKVDLALPAHKISLLMQAELGGVEFPNNDQFAKHKMQFSQDKAIIFQQVNRLIRCIIDCQIHLGDSIGVRHALELARSFGSRAWDNSPLQMKQIDQIGPMAVRKLANAGINSVEALEATEQHRIEMLLGKNPPFGAKLLGRLSGFPKPRVTVKMIGKVRLACRQRVVADEISGDQTGQACNCQGQSRDWIPQRNSTGFLQEEASLCLLSCRTIRWMSNGISSNEVP